MKTRKWWQDGVVYQIYPRSFMDSNGDGVGDLVGITQRLEHLSWLGVDAIWLSPCFRSPMKDFGYDVSDYCDIDPVFGTLADFDSLVEQAHSRAIHVLLDWVPNHSSDRHAWFRESRRDRNNPKRDWYVWRDAKPDGTPPNNWMSHFGGGAWSWDQTTEQFYLHSFLPEQPDLNWRNPELVEAMHGVLRFWLDRGVDGFRIDVIHAIAKDPEFRDNPLIEGRKPDFFGQHHVHDQNHPDVHRMLRGIRAVLDEYEDRMTVGEVSILNPDEVGKYYGNDDELHLAFNFSFLRAPWSAERFRAEIEHFEAALPDDAWPDAVLSNHDASRHASRFDDPMYGDARARVAAMLLLTQRGTPFLYYGEEIGMRNVEIPTDRLRDPVALNIHPKAGRDPERTPMQWEAGQGAGFSEAEPWLPNGSDAGVRNVAGQREDPASLLCFYRDMLALRRATPALYRGSYRSLEAPADVLAYEREFDGARVWVVLNFGNTAARIDLADFPVAGGLRSTFGSALPDRTGGVELAAAEGLVLVVG
ncbi:MAG: alpha-amylase family glycosyl hydrolase [Myxococcota bacterium]